MGDSEQANHRPKKLTVTKENAAFSLASEQVVGHAGDDTGIKDDDTDVKEVDCQSVKEVNGIELQNGTPLQEAHQESATLEQASAKRMSKIFKGSLAAKPKAVPIRDQLRANQNLNAKISKPEDAGPEKPGLCSSQASKTNQASSSSSSSHFKTSFKTSSRGGLAGKKEICADGTSPSSSSHVLSRSVSSTSRCNVTVPQPFALATDRRASLGGRAFISEAPSHSQPQRITSVFLHSSSNEAQVAKMVDMPLAIKTSQEETFKSEADYTDMVDAHQMEEKPDEDDAESVSSVESKLTKGKPSGANGFSFKCDERAEKRKQFYTKLVELHTAKEKEKSQIQAKTKEEMEAEIKQLRKSLTFKATPMPMFYREGAPPKVELKKIPTTRAKSPKLGRRSSSVGASSTNNLPGFDEEGEDRTDELGNSNRGHLRTSHVPASDKALGNVDSLGPISGNVNEVNGHPKGLTMEMKDVNSTQTLLAPYTGHKDVLASISCNDDSCQVGSVGSNGQESEIVNSSKSKNGKSQQKEETHHDSGAQTLIKERVKALTSLRKGTHTLKPVTKKAAVVTAMVSANVTVQS